jgi:hypothetical protein
MSPPQKLMVLTSAGVSRAVISPSRSALSKSAYLSARSLPLPLPSLSPWRAEHACCAEGGPRALLSTTSDGPCDRPLPAILGPKQAYMGVILVKSGKPQDRLPILVCQAAPGETGDLPTLLTALPPPRAGCGAMRRCKGCTTAVSTAVCCHAPQSPARARPVATARSNPIFTMRRIRRKASRSLPGPRAAHRPLRHRRGFFLGPRAPSAGLPGPGADIRSWQQLAGAPPKFGCKRANEHLAANELSNAPQPLAHSTRPRRF